MTYFFRLIQSGSKVFTNPIVSFFFVRDKFVGENPDVIARCTVNGHWYSAQMIAVDYQTNSGFVHYRGWDNTYDEWLPAEHIRIKHAGDFNEGHEYWSNSFDHNDDDYYDQPPDYLLSYVLKIHKTFEQVVKHMTGVFVTVIIIIMLFVVLLMSIMK